MSSSNASQAAAGPLPRIAPKSAPSAVVSFEVVSRFGVTLATAETEQQARQDVRYRASRGISGLSVVEVERTERRRIIYRARKVAT